MKPRTEDDEKNNGSSNIEQKINERIEKKRTVHQMAHIVKKVVKKYAIDCSWRHFRDPCTHSEKKKSPFVVV